MLIVYGGPCGAVRKSRLIAYREMEGQRLFGSQKNGRIRSIAGKALLFVFSSHIRGQALVRLFLGTAGFFYFGCIKDLSPVRRSMFCCKNF